MTMKPYIRRVSITAPTTRWEIVDPPDYMEPRKDDSGKPLIFLNRDDARQVLGMAPGRKPSDHVSP